MLVALNVFSIFKFYFDYNEGIFNKSKINIYGVYNFKKETCVLRRQLVDRPRGRRTKDRPYRTYKYIRDREI